MSVDTNTPNGDSKDLYSNSPDSKNIETNFLALEERDPQRGQNDSDAAGANSTVVPVEVGTIDAETIQRVGYVGITINNVLNIEDYKNTKSNIKKRAAISKEAHNRVDKTSDGR